MKITREQLLSWDPCCRKEGERYSDENLDKLFGGREALTPQDVAQLGIPPADFVWVWTRPGALPDDVRQRWIDRVVRRAVEAHALKCGIPEVEEWAERWISGEDRSRSASRSAAEAVRAARAAERAALAAKGATWATWCAALAAGAAAWAEEAAWAAWSAVEAAEAAVEQQKQVEDLLHILAEEEK
jgi:hypothetical protein